MVPYPAVLLTAHLYTPLDVCPVLAKFWAALQLRGVRGVEDTLLPPRLPSKANLQPTTAATLLRVSMLVEKHTRKSQSKTSNISMVKCSDQSVAL